MLRKTLFILSAFALATATSPSIARADEPSSAAQRACDGPGGHGPLGLVHSALTESIGLSSDQRAAIEASLASLRPTAVEESRHASHRAALAAQIRRGAIDEAAITAAAPTVDERSAHEAAAAAVLSTLHDTLTADQRTALVTAVLAEHRGGADARQRRDEGPMRMFEGLGLSDAQETAVRAALESGRPDPATMRAELDAMKTDRDAKLRAFAGDSFDARTFLTPPAGAPRHELGPDRMVHDLATVVALLTPAQREALARRIEAGPPQRSGSPA